MDVQAGGQPGLPGAGLAQLQNALAQWNGAGALFTYAPRSLSAAPRQGTVFGNSGVVTHVANDPFAEISNTGGTLAVAFSWFTTAISSTVNGQPFRRMLEVVIISNDGTTAQNFITNPSCFNQVMLHEQGHALGLGHSAVPTAVMAATVSFAQCSAAPRPLQPDDIAGIRFIYPGGSTPPPGGPGTPTNVTAVVNGPVLTVGWTSAGVNATGNRLDFRSGAAATGPVLVSVTVGPTTSITVGIPAGTVGTFNVTVTAFVGAVGGLPSAPAVFTIGGGPCVAPPTPTGLTGQIVGTLASVSFNPSPGATSYIVQAGTAFGLSNLFNANIGGSTSVSAPVPAGFTAFVRVIAVNACGQSAPTADLALGFSLGAGDLQVTLTWNTATDIDLHIREPNGTHVYYAARNGTTARLDRDDTDGFGPENIFVNSGAAAAGVYQVYIVHYSGAIATTSTIQIRLRAGTPNEQFRVFTRASSAGNPALGFNVADVNVGTNTITETAGTRAAVEGDAITVKK